MDKNFIKHNLTTKQIEEAFVGEKPHIMEDARHSLREKRYMLWNKSIFGSYLTIIFTIRSSKVRVVSARPMNKKERSAYEKTKSF
jgi:uncharacterized DUF497 family protein